jgi:serine/threonine-protein kinase RsbW
MAPEILIQLPTNLSLLDLAHRLAMEVCEGLGVPELESEIMSNAVLEAVGNAMRHGNKEDPTLLVWIRFAVESNSVSVSIEDQGAGVDLSMLEDPTSNENLLKSSGRGFFLMRAFADSVDISQSETGGTVVKLTKAFSLVEEED